MVKIVIDTDCESICQCSIEGRATEAGCDKKINAMLELDPKAFGEGAGCNITDYLATLDLGFRPCSREAERLGWNVWSPENVTIADKAIDKAIIYLGKISGIRESAPNMKKALSYRDKVKEVLCKEADYYIKNWREQDPEKLRKYSLL